MYPHDWTANACAPWRHHGASASTHTFVAATPPLRPCWQSQQGCTAQPGRMQACRDVHQSSSPTHEANTLTKWHAYVCDGTRACMAAQTCLRHPSAAQWWCSCDDAWTWTPCGPRLMWLLTPHHSCPHANNKPMAIWATAAAVLRSPHGRLQLCCDKICCYVTLTHTQQRNVAGMSTD